MNLDADQILSELLTQGDLGEAGGNAVDSEETLVVSAAPRKKARPAADSGGVGASSYSQWALGGHDRYLPIGSTTARLSAGVYVPTLGPGDIIGFEGMRIQSDSIYRLPDMATQAVLEEVDRFWRNEERYRRHNLLYKRGILLWGKPGSGKTVTVKLLIEDLIDRDGVVIIGSNIALTLAAIKNLRRIEPDRNLILVLEDLDEIIRYNGEAIVLSLLDGEHNTDRVLNLATTNYPEVLGARIVNRPSRFDRRIYVDMPSAAARHAYLVKATHNGLSEDTLERWVADTKDLSIAHLRELVAAVYCLEQPYDEVITRLTAMSVPIKGEDGFAKPKGLGFRNEDAKQA